MRPLVTLSLILALAPTAPLAAQFVQPLPQTTPPGDADALADQVRALAANPSDLNALVRAGELALKLEDPTAAAAFFARAERIDPRNGRVNAGFGQLLVQSERPGEALRRFAQAESYGARVSSFAADRGLAYDLIGEQERAQRDYRLALKSGPNDETTRRYALSLGISGKREEALALLDPLLRKSDRGAWRARAFILAMSGNRVDAEQIATTMMPAGMSQGLQPFFDRLPTLSPVDRAFAVHFGEVRASPQRLADARMVPQLPALGVDPDARELAAAAQARAKPARAEVAKVEKAAKRKHGRRDRVEVAVQAVAPPVAMSLPAPPAYIGSAGVARSTAVPGATNFYVQQLPGARAPTPSYSPVAQANRAAAAASTSYAQPGVPASAAVAPQRQAAPVYQPVQPGGGRVMPLAPLQSQPLPSTAVAQTRWPTQSVTPITPYSAAPVSPATPPAETATRVETAAPMQRAMAPAPGFSSTGPAPQAVAAAPVVRPPEALVTRTESVSPSRYAASTPAVSTPTSVASTSPAAAVPTAVVRASSEDAALKGIVAKIGVPGAELGVAPVEPAPAPPPAPVEVAAVSPPSAAEPRHRPTPETSNKAEPNRPSEAKPVVSKAKVEPVLDRKAAETKRGADRRALDAKKLADEDDAVDAKKAGAKKLGDKKTVTRKGVDTDAEPETKKAADTKKKTGKGNTTVDDADAEPDTKKTGKLASKKADAKKAADAKKTADAKKKDPKVLEPSRIWVQVSGGANENDLPKQWNKLRGDQPAMFKNRQGYSTPLRATNRILTGPFASESEAQAYVNKLAKQGVSGFLFTSDAGQKVSKLPTK
ncbi:SPOR domain-containing protein [Sphingomonas sp. BAUL-RG-20F-R05-02]|uniref:SPOR domain-containing protein n=1 Tax=Sphingomonas sp. BAUL-RG-20F-R05-02 TaxID=2914830 RepID=UPI001F5861D8|nr:SPOR domain-containing protein [Sphingomonas sp. BAUL-RG-20F-R05-02]